MPKCPKCNATYGTDDQFCPKCGERLSLEVKPEKKKEVTLEKPEISAARKTIGVIFILMGVFGIIFDIYVLGKSYAAVGMFFFLLFFFAIGLNLIRGSEKFTCPYCGKQLNAEGGKDSMECERCKERILLKWEGKKKKHV